MPIRNSRKRFFARAKRMKDLVRLVDYYLGLYPEKNLSSLEGKKHAYSSALKHALQTLGFKHIEILDAGGGTEIFDSKKELFESLEKKGIDVRLIHGSIVVGRGAEIERFGLYKVKKKIGEAIVAYLIDEKGKARGIIAVGFADKI